ncbi:MAG: 6-carboxytetrahydropterin synthase [Candidatus Caldarchaeales archaeon]
MLGLRELIGLILRSEGVTYELRTVEGAGVIETANSSIRVEDSGRFEVLTRRGERFSGHAILSSEGFVSLRLKDPSLNFDYSHFLPHIEKCSTLHGHTATVSLEVLGLMGSGGYLIDFGELKRALKSVLNELDHKLIASVRYVVDSADGRVTLRFLGKGGEYALTLPSDRVVLLKGESTAENISMHIARRVAELLGAAPLLVRVELSEGLGKSAVSEVLVSGRASGP